MLLRRLLFAFVACAALLCAQAPTAPVISARGVTNFFTQEPAPGTVGLGGLVQIGGLNLGPSAGDAQTGISSTVKIFSRAGDPIQVDLPSAASTLTATSNGLAATLPGKPVRIATIDPDTGQFQTSTPAAGAGTGAGGAAPAPTVDIDGLKHVYAFANVGQNRIAVIAGDDALKPTKAAFAIVNPSGAVTFSKGFPAGWLPLLTAEAPERPNQTAAPPLPTEPATFDAASRLFYVLARATDASKDAFLTFGLADTTDPNVVAFPDGWFAASCTADIRLFALDRKSVV